MSKRTRVIVLVLICLSASLLMARGLQAVRRSSVLSRCPEPTLVGSEMVNPSVQAEKVVVKPWQGRHNVYGVFVLPADYKPSRFFSVKVDGVGTYCGQTTILRQPLSDISTQPGKKVVVGLLRTRTSMLLLTKGKRDVLNQPENWVLQVEKQG